MQKLLELCTKPYSSDNWSEKSKNALSSLFGSPNGRYSTYSEKEVQLRTPITKVPFTAIMHGMIAPSCEYSGMSSVEVAIILFWWVG